MSTINIRPATVDDHPALVKLARKSQYTKDFSNSLMFSSAAAYSKGWILVAEHQGEPLGLSCVRHKTREPVTMVYFIVVEEALRGRGVGRWLLEEVVQRGPHQRVQLSVMKDNEEALGFYQHLGFEPVGETMGGRATLLEKTFNQT